MSCSKTCPERRRRCSPARSRAASTTRSRRASSARPTCSRPMSPASRSSTRRRASSSSRKGPLFANILLVDEINRAMPKTQSALLEAMAEHQVTVDGVTRRLPDPFLLMATENPIEYEGTFPLPEAQLDRFFLRTSLGYPGEEQEIQIVREQRHGHPLDGLEPTITQDEIRELRLAVRGGLRRRAARRVDRQARARDARAARRSRWARRCAARSRSSRRPAPGLCCTSRDYVRPEDVEQLFIPVLGHRLMLAPSYLAETTEPEPGRDARADQAAVPRAHPRAAAGLGLEPSADGVAARTPRPRSDRCAGQEPQHVPAGPEYRLVGLPFGGSPSLAPRPRLRHRRLATYVRGDPVSTIDWRASARLSTALGRDEFVVREQYADEAPRVVVLTDRRPSMGIYAPPFPWLSKPAVVRSTTELIVQSAEGANAAVAYLDYAGSAERGGEPFWLPPSGRAMAERIEARDRDEPGYDAPEDGVARALEFLPRFRSELSSGTFVFVISDFLGPTPPESAWLTAAARRWEVVPVIVQDPVWEQSFPLVGPLVLPLADPRDGQVLEVRLTRREARARRDAERAPQPRPPLDVLRSRARPRAGRHERPVGDRPHVPRLGRAAPRPEEPPVSRRQLIAIAAAGRRLVAVLIVGIGARLAERPGRPAARRPRSLSRSRRRSRRSRPSTATCSPRRWPSTSTATRCPPKSVRVTPELRPVHPDRAPDGDRTRVGDLADPALPLLDPVRLGRLPAPRPRRRTCSGAPVNAGHGNGGHGEVDGAGDVAETFVASRLTAKRRATTQFRWAKTAPAPSYAVSPGHLAGGLTVAAALLAVVALALIGFELVRLVERRRRASPVVLTPLEAALLYTRDAAGRPDPADRRKALGLLAKTLDQRGRHDPRRHRRRCRLVARSRRRPTARSSSPTRSRAPRRAGDELGPVHRRGSRSRASRRVPRSCASCSAWPWSHSCSQPPPRPATRSSTSSPCCRPTGGGMIVLDLSASISTDTYSRIGTTLTGLAQAWRPLRSRHLLGPGVPGTAARNAGLRARAVRPLLHASEAGRRRARRRASRSIRGRTPSR